MKENILLQLNEEIKPIQGYEDLYSITSNNRVWSHAKQKGCVWKDGNFRELRINVDGYLTVTLHKNKKRITKFVHKLKAQAFIPNPQNFPEVNHKDGNKLNLNLDNLEWCTKEQNMVHAIVNKLRNRDKISKYYGVTYCIYGRSKQPWIVQIIHNGRRFFKRFYTEIEAAQAYNNYVIEHNLNRPLNILNKVD